MSIDEIISDAGGVAAIARALGVNHSSVCGWRRQGRVPVKRAIEINEKLGVPLHEMRPDFWPVPEAAE